MKCAKRIQIGKSKYTTLEIVPNDRNPHDRRNGIGPDHEVRLELVDLVHGRRSRGGVGIRDRDQVGH